MRLPRLIRTLAYLSCIAGGTASAADRPPTELGNQATNVVATSAITPQTLARRSDRSGCDGGSDDTANLAIAANLSTRGSTGTIRVKGGQLDTDGIWRALYWDRNPDHPLCAFLAERSNGTTRLVLYGIRHSHQSAAVSAVERGNFLCRCRALARAD